jgi:hypothetical protein
VARSTHVRHQQLVVFVALLALVELQTGVWREEEVANATAWESECEK